MNIELSDGTIVTLTAAQEAAMRAMDVVAPARKTVREAAEIALSKMNPRAHPTTGGANRDSD